MATHKHIDAICIVITVCTLLLTFLFMNGKALGIQAVASEENGDALFTENDLNAVRDDGDATQIILSDKGSTVDGSGAYVNQGDVYIVCAGNYVLSGELSDGTILIEANGDDEIRLILDGVSVNCEDDAAIRVEQAGKVILTLQDGTENILSSGPAYSGEAVSAGVDGTVYSRDDLTVNGTGTLQVTAEYQHGIVCNDDFAVTGGTLSVTAVQDAIHANDSVRVKDADLTLSAGSDGITVSNDGETSCLYVESGNITIPSCLEGLEAVQIFISGGTLDIMATDDGLNANGYSGNSVIQITGGEIAVTVENGRDADGIDSNNDIFISGGKLLVSVGDTGGSCAIDYGSEYGGKCEISGGTVLACGSSGMAEGFDSTSTQGFLMQTASAAAGTTVTVQDADGNDLLSEKVPCSFSSVLVSTPEMKVGDTCTLIVGDAETELTIDNSSGSGGYGGFGGGKMTDDRMSGGRMPGGNGEESGMQPPEMQDGLPQNGAEEGMTPPDLSSDLPQDGAVESMAPSDPPSDLPQNGAEESMTPPDLSSDLPQNGVEKRMTSTDLPQENMRGRGNSPQAADDGTSFPAETLLLLGVSVIVLLAGCVIAVCYKRGRRPARRNKKVNS